MDAFPPAVRATLPAGTGAEIVPRDWRGSTPPASSDTDSFTRPAWRGIDASGRSELMAAGLASTRYRVYELAAGRTSTARQLSLNRAWARAPEARSAPSAADRTLTRSRILRPDEHDDHIDDQPEDDQARTKLCQHKRRRSQSLNPRGVSEPEEVADGWQNRGRIHRHDPLSVNVVGLRTDRLAQSILGISRGLVPLTR